MQLLYGRDEIDYKVLSKSPELSGNIESVLINDYLVYDFVKNKSDYSDSDKEPFSIIYCTTNLDGYLNDEMILVAKNSKNKKYITPSRYAHARLFEIEEESFKENFLDIFRYSFVDSDDSEKYKGEDIDSYIGTMTDPKETTSLSEAALKSILYLLFDNYRAISNTVYIIIDSEGDSYNERSIDVIRQVYEKIPYFMRKIIGFSSYGTLNQKYSNRIKLVAMTRENSDFDGELKVDLLNLDLQKIEKITSAQSKLVVDYILGLDDLNKKALFEYLDLENSKSRLSIKDLYNICLSRKLWKDSSDFDKMSSWIHNIINPNELEEDLFYDMMDIIESDLNSEIFNNYLISILSKEENISEAYLDKNSDLYNLLLFEDILSVDYKSDYNIKIDIDIDYILNWWSENIISMFKRDFEEADFSKILKQEQRIYENLDLQGENYLKLRAAMLEKIDKLLLDEERSMEKFVLEEKENLAVKFENIENINTLDDLEDEIRDLEVVYDKNRDLLKTKYGAKFKEIVDCLYKSNNNICLDGLEEFVDEYREYLSDNSFSYIQVLKDDQADIFKHRVQKMDRLSELENLMTSQNIKDKAMEDTILDRFEFIIKSFDIGAINNDRNIFWGQSICENIKYTKDVLSRPLIAILVDRDVNLDLDNLENIFDAITKKIDFIEKNKNRLAFNVDDYNLNIKINNTSRQYIIKFEYLNDLFEHIKSKQNKSRLSISKLISKNINPSKKAFFRDNKELLNLIDKYLKQ